MKFTILEAPITKKNSQQIIKNPRTKRLMIIPSKAYRTYESRAIEYIPELLIDYPINVEAKFYMPTRRRVDLVNLQEALLDVLVKAGCIIDDNSQIVAKMDGCEVLYDKLMPRTEVTLRRIENVTEANDTRTP